MIRYIFFILPLLLMVPAELCAYKTGESIRYKKGKKVLIRRYRDEPSGLFRKEITYYPDSEKAAIITSLFKNHPKHIQKTTLVIREDEKISTVFLVYEKKEPTNKISSTAVYDWNNNEIKDIILYDKNWENIEKIIAFYDLDLKVKRKEVYYSDSDNVLYPRIDIYYNEKEEKIKEVSYYPEDDKDGCIQATNYYRFEEGERIKTRVEYVYNGKKDGLVHMVGIYNGEEADTTMKYKNNSLGITTFVIRFVNKKVTYMEKQYESGDYTRTEAWYNEEQEQYLQKFYDADGNLVKTVEGVENIKESGEI